MIIPIGVVGAGKSTQGKLLAERLDCKWISTGEIFRSTLSGKRLRELEKGNLINDAETIRIVEQSLKNLGLDTEFVLDGFPRTQLQAEWLIKQVKAGHLKLTAVFYLKLSEDEAIKRLAKRGRVDDGKEAVSRRFQKYKRMTLPIIDIFRQNGIKIYNINAAQSPEAVHRDIIDKLQV